MTIPHDPTIAKRPINVLNLPDYARDQLAWLGICTVGELIATLPKGPHAIGPRTWTHIQRYLEVYLAKQSDVTQGASHTKMVRAFPPPAKPKSPVNELASYPATFEDLPSAKLVSDRSETVSQLESLPEALEDHPVAKLAVHTYAINCLQLAGIETIGELWAILTQGYSSFPVPGIGKSLWNEIQDITTRYVTSRTGDRVRGRLCDQATEYINAVTEDNQCPCVARPELPVEFLDHPISELDISVRAYNCLQRADISTVGRLLTILPQGHSTIRMAGPKTWSEIEDAAADYLIRHSMLSASTPDASTLSINPTALTTSEQYGHSHQCIEALELPSNITEALKERDITTVQALAVLPLFQLARVSELSALTHEDWFSLMPAIKDCDAPERARPVLKDAGLRPSLLTLNLSARPLNCLVRAGILDLETLTKCTLVELVSLRNFGAKSIEELLARMRAGLDSGAITLDDTVLHTSQQAVQASSISALPANTLALPIEPPELKSSEIQAPAILSLDERLSAWFTHLNEHQRKVLQGRYGLVDGQELTLDEIGEQLERTRERVRQIETKALRRLLGPSSQQAVRALVAELHHAIVTSGGIMSEAELGDTLAEIAEGGDVNVLGAVRLLLGSSEKYIKIKGMQAWCLPHLSALIPLVNAETINLLHEALAPISGLELLQRFKQTQLYKDHCNELNDGVILGCVRLNEKIVEREDGYFGLESWQHHWQDDIVMALRRLGQPTHYTAIADAINASLQNSQHVTAKMVHIRLMQHPDIFVWIGRRGTYGLKEWGIERAVSYVDALTQILQDAGHPLAITEILAALVKLRPYYDEVSVQITLGTNAQFRTFPGNTFGLAKWQEDDFAGGHYRLQRLFASAEGIMSSKPKREIVESLSTVDDFMARIQSNHDV